MTLPLSVLDLAPVLSGGTVSDALAHTVDLARRADDLGYRRYWVAEHHFAPGVAASAPAVLIALLAGATTGIRLGSGAVQLGHQTPVSVVEQFGLIDALHPGRLDLGLGRSGGRFPPSGDRGAGTPDTRDSAEPPGDFAGESRVTVEGSVSPATRGQVTTDGRPDGGREVGGLLIPPAFDWSVLAADPRLAFQAGLLQQPGARTPAFAEQVDDILAFLSGTFKGPEGQEAHAVPGENADVEVWILGSSGGQSARVAGERGLPFAANYHVSPATVLEAVDAYRAAFRPSAALAEPYVIVSADVLVAPTDEEAALLGSPYGLWVADIRAGRGAQPYPTPARAARESADRSLVGDRVDTRFVGSPRTVLRRLRTLRAVTGADELLVTTITHAHADRVRSYELLAEAWRKGESDAR
ncbi:LLM class flavin-dependent oxidoreductase [Nonomuraea longicatena]|uniref:LLM class flavin-dependent oxidoreductase n=1 Tax=Nonomuraea longicatena TaxID=83682 RepID=A0ABN1NZ03_9ACTN